MGSVNLAILFVFIGCGSNVFFLEHLINLDPNRNCFKFYIAFMPKSLLISAVKTPSIYFFTTKFVFETSKVEILLHVANFYSLHLNALRTLSGSLKYLYNAIYYLSLYSLQENVTIMNDSRIRRPSNLYDSYAITSLKENINKVNVINNWAFSFKVPLTLHIVFRAGSLVTNLLLSRLILKRQFSRSKYISVATITLGTSKMV